MLFATLAIAAVADDQVRFLQFLKDFNKEYAAEELFFRFGVFKNTLMAIEEHNSENHTWTMGVNQFSDLTSQEFQRIYLGFLDRNSAQVEPEVGFSAPNVEVDWSKKSAVTGVKDQGQCGSCWAFSTTGGIEGAIAVAKSTLPNLSEQQLVDCAGSAGNQGCNGGLMDNAFKWVISNGGIAAETAYTYTARDGTCKKVASSQKITSYKDVGKTESALLTAIQSRPISIAVDARTWQNYKSGVYGGCAASVQLDHGVLAVGYSDNGGYWLVKNSWGGSWGESGYIRLKKGNNQCGLTNEASYPVA